MGMYRTARLTPHKIPVKVTTRRETEGEIGSVTPRQKLNTVEPVETTDRGVKSVPVGDSVDWQDKALRLQADMENFRRRQLRRADETIAAEQKRLLLLLLPTIDNLERALNHQPDSDEALRQGLELIYRDLLHKLSQEGVTRIDTRGQRFDPEWHEAAAAVPAREEPDTIIEEVQAGFKLGDKLLRPAQVVVAA